jgi:hypothetical protein
MSGDDKASQPTETQSRGVVVIHRPRLLLALGAAALALAVFVATQVIGVLFAIVSPAAAPLPPDVTELRHENTTYGVDDWLYGTDHDACEILEFYRENGGTCQAAPFMCGEDVVLDVTSAGQNVGSCSADVEFSIFSMRWEVNIATGYRSDGVTQFRLSREVFWFGSPPPRSAD